MIVNLRRHCWALPRRSSLDLKPTFCQGFHRSCSGISVCRLAGSIYRLQSNHYLTPMLLSDKHNKNMPMKTLFSLMETQNKRWLGGKDTCISSGTWKRTVKAVPRAFSFNGPLHHCCLYSRDHKWRSNILGCVLLCEAGVSENDASNHCRLLIKVNDVGNGWYREERMWWEVQWGFSTW